MTNSLDIFGRTFACECGKTHRIEPREIVLADDAIAQLPAACRRHAPAARRLAVVSDARTWQVAGAAVAEALCAAGLTVHSLAVEDPHAGASPVCDDVTKEMEGPGGN